MKDKGNDGKGNNQERDLWETKQSFWNKLDKKYKFSFDCCASQENKKTPMFSDNFELITQHFLKEYICWMNPPFSKDKEMFKHFFKVINKGVAIYRCDNMETKIWQEIILPNCDWILIPKGRINYTPFDIKIKGNSTRFPSALIGKGVKIPKEIDGMILKVVGLFGVEK